MKNLHTLSHLLMLLVGSLGIAKAQNPNLRRLSIIVTDSVTQYVITPGARIITDIEDTEGRHSYGGEAFATGAYYYTDAYPVGYVVTAFVQISGYPQQRIVHQIRSNVTDNQVSLSIAKSNKSAGKITIFGDVYYSMGNKRKPIADETVRILTKQGTKETKTNEKGYFSISIDPYDFDTVNWRILKIAIGHLSDRFYPVERSIDTHEAIHWLDCELKPTQIWSFLKVEVWDSILMRPLDSCHVSAYQNEVLVLEGYTNSNGVFSGKALVEYDPDHLIVEAAKEGYLRVASYSSIHNRYLKIFTKTEFVKVMGRTLGSHVEKVQVSMSGRNLTMITSKPDQSGEFVFFVPRSSFTGANSLQLRASKGSTFGTCDLPSYPLMQQNEYRIPVTLRSNAIAGPWTNQFHLGVGGSADTNFYSLRSCVYGLIGFRKVPNTLVGLCLEPMWLKYNNSFRIFQNQEMGIPSNRYFCIPLSLMLKYTWGPRRMPWLNIFAATTQSLFTHALWGGLRFIVNHAWGIEVYSHFLWRRLVYPVYEFNHFGDATLLGSKASYYYRASIGINLQFKISW